jgi:hypothetical protein
MLAVKRLKSIRKLLASVQQATEVRTLSALQTALSSCRAAQFRHPKVAEAAKLVELLEYEQEVLSQVKEAIQLEPRSHFDFMSDILGKAEGLASVAQTSDVEKLSLLLADCRVEMEIRSKIAKGLFSDDIIQLSDSVKLASNWLSRGNEGKDDDPINVSFGLLVWLETSFRKRCC